MNVMNSNNIDNRLQSTRELASQKSKIQTGQEKIDGITLKATDRIGGEDPIDKSHVDEVGDAKVVSPTEAGEKKIKRKRKSPEIPWKKPEGMPKRPLSAYNLFFQDRRKSIMQLASANSETSLDASKKSGKKASKGKSGVGFANLARTIGTEWRALPAEQKEPYESLAANDKARYAREMKVWRAKEKERKAMSKSNLKGNAQSFQWSDLASISAARKGFGGDIQSMRKVVTETSLPLSDMVSGIGAQGSSPGMLHLSDYEAAGAFDSSIYRNYNINPYSMNASSDQVSNMMMMQRQQHQDLSSFSSGGFNTVNKRQLSPFSSIVRESLEQSSGLRENFPFDAQTTESYQQYQNHLFLPSPGFKDSSKSMPWINPRNGMNMDSVTSTSIDLEPLPLPDNNQQEGKLSQKTRESQMGYAGPFGLQQMQMKEQQQQTTSIASNEQVLRRVSTGGAPSLSEGWGQNSSWNARPLDANEPIELPFAGRNVGQDTVTKRFIMSSQDIGSNPLGETHNRGNDVRPYSQPSNQDLYRFYNDEPH